MDAGNCGPPLHLLLDKAKHKECHRSAESSAEPAKVPKILLGLVLQGMEVPIIIFTTLLFYVIINTFAFTHCDS